MWELCIRRRDVIYSLTLGDDKIAQLPPIAPPYLQPLINRVWVLLEAPAQDSLYNIIIYIKIAMETQA